MRAMRSMTQLLRFMPRNSGVRSAVTDSVVPIHPGEIYVDMPLFPISFVSRWKLIFQIGIFCGVPFAVPFYGLRRALMKKY
uniref:Cytochrome c oxidase polypeptide VIIc n=1 Tax=Trichuris muris TaxID=70415 RepID=A0A5S6QFC9_TRIMR